MRGLPPVEQTISLMGVGCIPGAGEFRSGFPGSNTMPSRPQKYPAVTWMVSGELRVPEGSLGANGKIGLAGAFWSRRARHVKDFCYGGA